MKTNNKKQARNLYKELKNLVISVDEPLTEEQSSHFSSIQSIILEKIQKRVTDRCLSDRSKEFLIKKELKKLVRFIMKGDSFTEQKSKSSKKQSSSKRKASAKKTTLSRAVEQWAQHEHIEAA